MPTQQPIADARKQLLLDAFLSPVQISGRFLQVLIPSSPVAHVQRNLCCPRNLKPGDFLWLSPTTNGLVDTKCHKDDGHQQDAKNGSHQHCKGKTSYLMGAPGSMISLRDSAFSMILDPRILTTPGARTSQVLTQVTPQV